MHRITVASFLFAVAVSGSAQVVPDSQIHVLRADGSELTIPSSAKPAEGFLVEFVAPPAALAAKSAGKTAIDYQATFTRFRNDLDAIANASKRGKAVPDVLIRREFSIVFNGVAVQAPRDVIEALRALPYVKRVVEDRVVHALADGPNITLIRADKVWSTLGTRGKGVTVAIIDTGIDYTHPALGGGFGTGFKVTGGWDFVNNDADPFDDNGHGTHVAGIVAGQSDTITGVAPEVSLLAFKVLSATGSGSESNVIAAIERAADPNQDGSTADHVDVANLSLGGSGNPDDPGSVAIDNATAAGVVFAIAAGNSGSSFHTISSPGTARSAITVGASDLTDKITSFSSRGPNMKDIAIKPDVVAPGLSILSSLPGNRYGSLSGTSMATPHVAGAAALLKALHRDWTPAQIKLALMNNAVFVVDDVQAVGAGRIDVFAAATTTLAIDPPTLSLGLAPTQTSWTVTRTLHVTNRGTQTRTYSVKGIIGPGELATFSPASVTLQAGGSADVTATITIDNAVTHTNPSSFSAGGQVSFTNIASTADVHTVQFSFTRAARATVTFDRAYPDALWVSDSRTSLTGGSSLDDHTSEALMLPGTWDMLVYTREFDNAGVLNQIDFIAREAVTLPRDTTIALTGADLKHSIVLAGRRETGQTLAGNGYASSGRIVIGGTSSSSLSLSFPWSPLHLVRVSDLTAGKSLLFYETLLDLTNNNFYSLQHPALIGVSADATLTTGGAALRGGAVQIGVPSASRGDRRLTAFASIIGGGGVTATAIVDSPLVNGRVFVSPDVPSGSSFGIGFTTIADSATQYTTPLLRVINDKLVSAGSSSSLLPWAYSGSSYQFGEGPRFPVLVFTPTGASKLNLLTEMTGPLGEVRVSDRIATTTTLRDSTDAKIAGGGYTTTLDLSARAGAYGLQVDNIGTVSPGVNATTRISMAIDSSRTDYIPPSLTTMTLFDGTGTLVTRLEPHGSGAFLFSAADFGLNASGSRVYQQLPGDTTHLSYRYSGETAWRPLSATQVIEDAGSGAGILFRADLAQVANVNRSLVDLKFELADAAGNTTTVTMTPAFSVGPEMLPRHRASR